MFIFLLFLFHATSFVKKRSYELEDEQKLIHESSNKNDDPPNSRFAFAASYTGESDNSYNFLQCIITLGGMLETVSPGYDRVLLVPTEIEISTQITEILLKIWTHIIRRPFLNCSSKVSDADDDYLFKLQAWTLTQYSKVLYVGADVLPLGDLSQLFALETPAAAIDFFKYSMNRYSTHFNTDFILLSPNNFDFAGLVEQVKIKHKKEKDSATPDAFVINTYMEDRITVFPLKSIIECGGFQETVLNEYPLNGTLAALAVHFGHMAKPWMSHSPLGELWKLFANNINERIQISSTYAVTFNADTGSESVDNFFQAFKQRHALLQQNIVVEDDVKETYWVQQKVPITLRNVISALALAFFGFFVLYALAKENVKHPIKQLIEKTGIYNLLS